MLFFSKLLTRLQKYERQTQKGKTLRRKKNHLIPFYSTELWLFPLSQSYNKRNSGIIHDSDTTDKIQKNIYTSNNNSEFDDNVFDKDPFFNNGNNHLIVFDIELYKSEEIDDDHYHHTR